MSLLDALLLDPPPFNVWIALRTDGVAGSGTQSDPYDGSVRTGPALSVTSLSNPSSGDQQPATVTTATAHGFANGDVVTLSGVTGQGAGAWNGTFPIYNVTTSTFQYYLQSVPAAAASGSPTASKITFLFDSLMSLMPANTTVNLGPGEFQTRGHAEAYATTGWVPRSGQKILGSGMDVTFLKVVYASSVDKLFMAIGGEYNTFLQSFEVSDFTVDSNLAGQLVLAGQTAGKVFSQVACGAIKTVGQDIRIRRIRAVNFGTQTPSQECFVFTTGGAHPDNPPVYDCVIEDCVLEKPSRNNVRETTCIIVGGGERPTDGVMAYHRGCVVRNCFINAEFQDNPVLIASLTGAGLTTATVTTRSPHGRAAGDWVRVSGAMENGVLSANYNGSFSITNVTSTTFQYTMPGTPSVDPTGAMWVGRWSSNQVAVAQNTGITLDPDNQTFHVTTVAALPTMVAPHFRIPGNNVVLSGVAVTAPGTNPFNAAFTIADASQIRSTTQLTFTLASPFTGSIDWSNSHVFIGGGHQGISADGGTGAVVEGNRVYNCGTGYYHDTGSTKDLVIRNNHFYRVNTAIMHSLERFSYRDYTNLTFFSGAKSTSAQPNPTRGGSDGKTATFRTALAHGYLPGQGVQILAVRVNASFNNPYNGYFVITSVSSTDPTLFTYVMNSDPGVNGDDYADPPGTPGGAYIAKWQVRRLLIENNLIELGFTISPSFGHPSGVYMAGGIFAPVYAFPQVVIRGNVIRQADGVFDITNYQFGLQVSSCGNLIIEDNIIDLNPYNRIIINNSSAMVECLDNQSPAGALVRGLNTDTNKYTEELATQIEDTLCIMI